MPLATELSEVGSIKAFPLPVADEGNALMAQRLLTPPANQAAGEDERMR